MRLYLTTCDDCPDWQKVSATERAARTAGDKHATRTHCEDLTAEQIVERNLNLAGYWTQRVASRGVFAWETVEDIHADALLGLWQAAKAWRPGHGANFGTFAAFRIKGAITDGRREREPRSRRQVEAGVEARAYSLDTQIEGVRSFAETLADPTDRYAEVDDADEHAQRVQMVRDAAEVLTDKQRHVLFGRMRGERLHVLAAEIGVTESRASQLESEAVRRLHTVLTAA